MVISTSSTVLLLLWYFSCVTSYPKMSKDIKISIRKRIRRNDPDPVEPDKTWSFENPFGYYPLPAYRPESLEPVFPMVHSFNNGFNYQDNTNTAMFGHLNVPIPSWGIWDLHADFAPQTGNPELQFGYLVAPLNPLNLSPNEIDTLTHDTDFKNRRKAQKPVSVNNLPGSGDYLGYGGKPYAPLVCKPPLCNPNVHTFATGAQYQQGLDFQLPGKLDFPIPASSPTKPSYRYSLVSDTVFGVQPVAFQYGHDINGINPKATAFKPSANSGNPFAMNALAHPSQPNTIPFVLPPLDDHNIFEHD